ncbi:MAG: heavy-metal-associated domain-containing protein [Proteobacteria bacterium]|nr:heavy-metal-associated domain-containing protein [Pseudomonadota bacterium]MBU1610846.1 heavy-metal-associated domain-containing protein [Pseudomonadota bacterium]
MKELQVKGMSCQHCVGSVTKAVETVDGVENVTVDLATGKVTYSGPDEAATTITANITKAGFEVV